MRGHDLMLKVTGPRPFPLAESTLTSNHMCVINTNGKQRWYHGDNYGFGDCVGLQQAVQVRFPEQLEPCDLVEP